MPRQQHLTSEKHENRRGPWRGEEEQTEQTQAKLPPWKVLLLADPHLARSVNAEQRAALLHASQQVLGNRVVQRLLHSDSEPTTPPVQGQVEEEEETFQAKELPGQSRQVTPAPVETAPEPTVQGSMMGQEVRFGPGPHTWEAIASRWPLERKGGGDSSLTGGVPAVIQRDDKKGKKETATSPSSQNTGPLNITERTLPNGQIQQTIRMPFTQVIARSETGDAEMAEEQMEQEKPIFISEIGPPLEIDVLSRDSINATLTHKPTVSPGGTVPPGEFGACGATIWWANVHITPGPGIYTVTADLVHDITWGIVSGTGPKGQVDIQDKNDSDIKACNYQLVASDLTPKMSDSGGRPPRTKFWAEDLTKRHELLHTRQHESVFGPKAIKAMKKWLNAQTATSQAEIKNTLLPKARAVEGVRAFKALTSNPLTEVAAYFDGARFYQARADAIKTKGDTGGYGEVSVKVTIRPKGGEKYKVDQKLYLIVSGENIQYSDMVSVSGSHPFKILPRHIFSDATNCTGDVTIDVMDADDKLRFSTVWSLPGQTTSSDENYEVTAGIVP